MRYKILVTSSRNYAESVSAHTTTLEFEDVAAANLAFEKLDESRGKVYNETGVKQAYVKLY